MSNRFWGAVLGKGAAHRLDRLAESAAIGQESCWRQSHERLEMLLQFSGEHWKVVEFGNCVLLVRGG